MSETKHADTATVGSNLSPPIFDTSNFFVVPEAPTREIKNDCSSFLEQLRKSMIEFSLECDKNSPPQPDYDEGCDHMFCGGVCTKIGPGTVSYQNKRLS